VRSTPSSLPPSYGNASRGDSTQRDDEATVPPVTGRPRVRVRVRAKAGALGDHQRRKSRAPRRSQARYGTSAGSTSSSLARLSRSRRVRRYGSPRRATLATLDDHNRLRGRSAAPGADPSKKCEPLGARCDGAERSGRDLEDDLGPPQVAVPRVEVGVRVRRGRERQTMRDHERRPRAAGVDQVAQRTSPVEEGAAIANRGLAVL